MDFLLARKMSGARACYYNPGPCPCVDFARDEPKLRGDARDEKGREGKGMQGIFIVCSCRNAIVQIAGGWQDL